ncbi:hypothetical protein HPP92_010518 [Vanilla planifolia]|uniref:Bifunctional inhibitor/plant lipid transfer protein/seed storage helical domain-containing protein n=1 Tax=Vanilla planifolia TaxID=51239 RepID=A0A835QU16_VANPL|nr:hypothetical protein HPP92_010518 [Vanilla planifolia]
MESIMDSALLLTLVLLSFSCFSHVTFVIAKPLSDVGLHCGECGPPKSPKGGGTPPITLPPVIGKPPVTLPPVIGKPPIILPPIIVNPPVILPPVIGKPPVTLPPVIGEPPIVGAPPVTRRKGCPSPPVAPKYCPVDTVKLGACLDILGSIVQIGDPAVQCCPLITGLASLDAAACLCTTIKLKLLNINVYLPIALELLITCGKTVPPGYTCP